MILGEQSDWAMDGTTPRNTSASWPHGWMMGTYHDNATNNRRQFNLTTVRYPPNSDFGLPGIDENHGANNPLSSAHTGGVQVLMMDGSVHFLSENVDMLNLRRLATRADRQVVGEVF